MKRHRLVFESLERRLVLDSIGLDTPLVNAIPFETLSDAYIASTRGTAQVEGRDLQVEVLFLVPPGTDASEAAAEALRNQGASPFQSAEYTFTGLEWDQFFDGYQDNDFVTQHYNPTHDPTGGNGLTALLNSHTTWNDVSTSSFTFDYGGTTNRWPSLVRESPGRQYLDGNNDVAWMRLSGFGVLGVTWYDIVADESDMALNTAMPWSTTGGNYDVETVFLHENGHVAGLGHSDDSSAVMYAYYTGEHRSLEADDIAGISELYPAEPGNVYDVAVVDVAAPSSVAQGEQATIDVTVENQGNYTETFLVTLTDTSDGVPIGSQNVTLTAGTSTTVSFAWDTTGEGFGLHTLIADADLATDEDSTDNSLATDVTVTDPEAVISVTEVIPNSGAPGAKMTVTVVGANFQDGATVDFGPQIAVRNVVFQDASLLNVNIRIHRRANLGFRDVTVTNPDGSSDTLENGFQVEALAGASNRPGRWRADDLNAMYRDIAHFYALEQAKARNARPEDNSKAKQVVDYLLEYL